MPWEKQIYVYAFLAVLGYMAMILDGAFTVVGTITTMLPPNLAGTLVGLAIHFFISWGQHTLIFHSRWLIKGLGMLLLLLNIVSNIYGITLMGQLVVPQLLGTLPTNPAMWPAAVLDWISGAFGAAGAAAPMPPWLFTALIIGTLGGLLAWYAEIIYQTLREEFVRAWRARPA